MNKMFGWDLPPGVRLSDISGNRPSDVAEEAFWEAFAQKLEDYKITGLELPKPGRSANFVAFDDLWDNDVFDKIIVIARDLGYEHGFNEGRGEEKMAQSQLETETDEQLRHWLEDHPTASAKSYIKKAALIRQELTSND